LGTPSQTTKGTTTKGASQGRQIEDAGEFPLAVLE